MSDTRRLFFALWPGAALRSQLAHYAQILADDMPCRLVPPDNLHVTLAFIGAVPIERAATLVQIGGELSLTPCELVFDHWAIWKQAGVLVLTASVVPQPLQQMVKALYERVTAKGFKLDTRPYRPHVTLARKVRGPEKVEAAAPLVWLARDYVLVESLPTEGVQYKVLATFAS